MDLNAIAHKDILIRRRMYLLNPLPILALPGTKPAKPAHELNGGEKWVLQQLRTGAALWVMSAKDFTSC